MKSSENYLQVLLIPNPFWHEGEDDNNRRDTVKYKWIRSTAKFYKRDIQKDIQWKGMHKSFGKKSEYTSH